MHYGVQLRNFALVITLCGFSAAAFAQAPKAKAPKAKAPDAKAPDAKAPDAKAPDAKAPDSKAPDAKAPGAKAPPTTPPAAPATDANKPAAAEFQRVLDEWKSMLKELRNLKVQYQSAALADQAIIQQKWKDLVEKGNEKVAELEAAGLKAYVEAPNEDPQLTRFLVKLADDGIQRDDYASTKRITDELIEHQCSDNQIYDSAAIAAYVLNDYDQAEKFFKLAKDKGVVSTYGKELDSTVKEYKDLWAKEKEIREAEAKADDLPRVRLTTNKGAIVIELFENEAPDTVGNFVSLIEKKFYDGLKFHRVLKNFMAQAGDPNGDGSGGPGYRIYGEQSNPNHRNHFQGSLSMAHTGDPDTGGSQFFITFKQTPHLNGKHTVFGRVIEGMEVLSKLQRRDPTAANPPAPDFIVTAEVIRKRDHVYQSHKVE